MSFFKKLSYQLTKGVSTATEKAQQKVELAKLNLEVSTKRKEIEKLYTRIGACLYVHFQEKDLVYGEVKPLCDQVSQLVEEIAELNKKIETLRQHKLGPGSESNELNPSICIKCKQTFNNNFRTRDEQINETEKTVSKSDQQQQNEEANASSDTKFIPPVGE